MRRARGPSFQLLDPLTLTLSPLGRGNCASANQQLTIQIVRLTLLIAALGGEGGGVLSNWIVTAAESLGFPVQSTSIPGVAQRTGATTYYIEIVPAADKGGRRPVLALLPGVGDIDVVLASELMEAGRAVAAGFVTPDRTLAIASTSRFYVMNEKIAMGDGRYDSGRLMQAIEQHSRARRLLDMEEIARRTGAMLNAVMLGVLAGSDALPIPAEAFEAAIRADGKAVESNLRGFRAGFDAAQEAGPRLAAGGSVRKPVRPCPPTSRAGSSKCRQWRVP